MRHLVPLVAAAVVVVGVAPRETRAQEIQLTGPLCGAPAVAGIGSDEETPWHRAELAFAAPAGGVSGLGGGVTLPALGLEARVRNHAAAPFAIGPALGLTRAFAANRRATFADLGIALEHATGSRATGSGPSLVGAVGLSALERDQGANAKLGLHAGAALELDLGRPTAPGPSIGVGVDLRTFERTGPTVGFMLRIGATFRGWDGGPCSSY